MERINKGSKTRVARSQIVGVSRGTRQARLVSLLTLAMLVLAGFVARAYNRPDGQGNEAMTRKATAAPFTADRYSREMAMEPSPASGNSPTSSRAGIAPAGRKSPTPGVPAGSASNPKLTNWAHIGIGPRGFDTKVINLPHAPFFLLVENRTGLALTSYRLDRTDGVPANIRQKDLPRDGPDWVDFLDLAPGRYLLSETGHPDWQCRITVSP